MNRIVCYCTFLFAISLHLQGMAQPTQVKVKLLADHYFVGDESKLKDGVNCFVLTDRKQYERFFGKTTRPDTPAFAREMMLVLLMPKSKKDAQMGFNRVDMKAGDFIEVYCDLDLNKGRMPYEAYPIAACVIPKYNGVKKMNFYRERGMKLIETVTIK